MLLGELGDDTIQGDGSIDAPGNACATGGRVGYARDATGALCVAPSVDDRAGVGTDGDDYIEGNGGADTIFGNLGQDDIVGGSSTWFGLAGDKALRPDTGDLVFGGSGTAISRNNDGSVSPSHARDADTIVGDNGLVVRLVSPTGVGSATRYLSFTYDDAYGQQLTPRAVTLLDYTAGGPDRFPTLFGGVTPSMATGTGTYDVWGSDEVHGDSGDDTIYTGGGNDAAYGDAGDDDIVGGWGNDWISGGTGTDGVIGDDGRILTSRNGSTEPLNGLTAVNAADRAVHPGQRADGHGVPRRLPQQDGRPDPVRAQPAHRHQPGRRPAVRRAVRQRRHLRRARRDFLHGGSGDDAISGAEALTESYAPLYDGNGGTTGLVRSDFTHPTNDGTLLGFVQADRRFTLYDEYDPRRRITLSATGALVKTAGGFEWFLNNRSDEGLAVPGCTTAGCAGSGTAYSDGDDVLFGDHGNDWLVGGTGTRHAVGRLGQRPAQRRRRAHDATTASTTPPTPTPTYEDRAVGGAGLDVLIANTGGDRLIDWVGEFNSYIVPFAPFGAGHREPPGAAGACSSSSTRSRGPRAPTRRSSQQNGAATAARNGEPFGEVGVVTPAGRRLARPDRRPARPAGRQRRRRQARRAPRRRLQRRGPRRASSSTAAAGRSTNGGHVGRRRQPRQGRGLGLLRRRVPARSTTRSPRRSDPEADRRLEGQRLRHLRLLRPDRLQVRRHRHLDQQARHGRPRRQRLARAGPVAEDAKDGSTTTCCVAVNGTTVTLLVDGAGAFTYTYDARVIDGVRYGLNKGLVGMGSDNSRGTFDNVKVQVLPPTVTYDVRNDLTTTAASMLDHAGQRHLDREQHRTDRHPAGGLRRRRPGHDWAASRGSRPPRGSSSPPASGPAGWPACCSTSTDPATTSSPRSTWPAAGS